MKTYCVKRRKDTENVDPKIVRTKNNINYAGLFAESKSQNLRKNKKERVY